MAQTIASHLPVLNGRATDCSSCSCLTRRSLRQYTLTQVSGRACPFPATSVFTIADHSIFASHCRLQGPVYCEAPVKACMLSNTTGSFACCSHDIHCLAIAAVIAAAVLLLHVLQSLPTKDKFFQYLLYLTVLNHFCCQECDCCKYSSVSSSTISSSSLTRACSTSPAFQSRLWL